ncbi:Putative Phosphoribosyltransferase [Synechococcus sp. RCC307]|nr:Putative Phosphoribosyltransferase [Synechococcus sp. RCC307]
MTLPDLWRARAQAALQSNQSQLLLVLAGTQTAAVPGISAAGATPDSRRFTAAADAELLWGGPDGPRPHALPPLPAGVSPALISWVAQQQLRLPLVVADAGAFVAPAVPHVQLGLPPAACLSSGAAMAPAVVERLLQRGRQLGLGFRQRFPEGLLVLAECVPGGTSTAEALLRGLGVDAAGLVSGSLRQPPHSLRGALVQQGLDAMTARGISSEEPLEVVAAVGDPFQAMALGVLQGLLLPAEGPGPQALLAGGSQMLALAGLWMASLSEAERAACHQQLAVVTTSWVMQEPGSNLELLAQRLAAVWGVQPPLFSSALRFDGCQQQALLDYECGYVKEGVGAGGLAWLTQLAGLDPQALAAACDQACGQLLKVEP